MIYLTQAQLETHVGAAGLIQLTDHWRNGQADTAAITQAISAASAEVDAWLSVRYELPLPSVPSLLIPVACDIAIWHLAAARRQADITEISARYDRAIKVLERIAAGKMLLPITVTPPPATTDTNGDGLIDAQDLGSFIHIESTPRVGSSRTVLTVPDWMLAHE